ncbi:MAG TPA: SH3 domain-containing protein [Actinomycetota bacterium]|nr:SH3 domain-containing protein [Actinomycetota bacterium]
METRARAAAVLGILIVTLVACSGGHDMPPAASHTPTPSATAKPKPALAGDYTVTATPCVNFRKNPRPGVNADIIVCVPNGSTVRADGQSRKNGGYTWYHVTYKNQAGWIANQYLQRVGASPSASAT